MKKLIAISVVFALVAGAAFAVDLGGSVTGTAYVIQGSTEKDSKVTSGGKMNGIRLQGSGETGDGDFGGWIRFDPTGGTYDYNGDLVAGIAWWKPIDQFKLSIGGNPDGIFAKEGYACWMFNQQASDVGVTSPSNAWGGGYVQWPYRMRLAFFGGFDDQRAFMTITPSEIADINVAIPFIAADGGEAADVFASSVAQIDLHLDFGNIALTWKGATMKGGDQPTVYAYFNLGSIENLSLDVGVGFQLANEGGGSNPMGFGLAVKYDVSDAFGLKFRALFGMDSDGSNGPAGNGILAEVLPYFALGDGLKAFVAVGINMGMPKEGDGDLGWHFNPYLEVGNDWGPKFFAGIRVESNGVDTGDGAIINWAVPVALSVSF